MAARRLSRDTAGVQPESLSPESNAQLPARAAAPKPPTCSCWARRVAIAALTSAAWLSAGCHPSRPPARPSPNAAGAPGMLSWATEAGQGNTFASTAGHGGAEGEGGGPSARRLRWPLQYVQIISGYGPRWGRVHEGIDLVAPTGTPVLAAASGEVVYSGNRIRGYGNMVVVKHEGELMTVYAHNSVLLVKAGDRVDAGQAVALSGQSGRASGPHLHFEVRRGQVPRDPLGFLPTKP